MSLNSTNFVNMGPIKSADMKQFVDLFTGVMNDQPVTFKNAMMVGGSQGTSTPPVKLFGSTGQTGTLLEMYPTAASATPTFGVSALGSHTWGPGSPAVSDTSLSRVATQNGHATDTAGILISPYLEVVGTIKSDGFTFSNQATLLGPGASPFLLQINQNLATNGWTQQTEIATPATPVAGQVKIYPKANRHLYILDSAGVESDLLGVGNVVVTEEFLPANAATQVTVTQVPSSVISVSRNGVIQSTTDGHYSRAGQTFTFSVAFDGNDRVVISYATGGVLGIAPDGSITGNMLANGTVTNAKLASDTARANLLTNGGFEVWQRGNGPFTGNGAYSADRWISSLAGTDTLSVSRNAATVGPASNYSAACTFVLGTGAGVSCLVQTIKSAENAVLAGTTITLSVLVRTSTANAVRVSLFDVTTSTSVYSGFHTGGGAFERLSVTYTVPSTTGTVQAVVYFAASCTAYLDNAMLVVGSQAADYAPMHPADDLARCERYYEVPGVDQTGSLIVSVVATAASQSARASFRYRQKKLVAPTVTRVGTFALGPATSGQPSIQAGGLDGFFLNVTSSAAGDCFAYNSGAGYVTVEANP